MMTTVAQFRNRKRSLSFNETSGAYVNIGNIDLGPGPLTIEHWIKSTTSPIEDDEEITYNKENVIEGRVRNGYFHVAWEPYWSWIGGNSTPITPGEWTHIATTYDGTDIIIYKNGEETFRRTQAGVIAQNSNTFKIGGRSTSTTSGSNPFNGNIRDVRIWKTARTAEEVRHSMYGIGGNEVGLFAWWPLSEGEGTTAYDNSINFMDGTIGSGATWDEEEGPTDFINSGYLEEELEFMVHENEVSFIVDANTYSQIGAFTPANKDLSWLEEDDNTLGNTVATVWVYCSDASYAYATTFEYTRTNNTNGIFFRNSKQYVVSPNPGTYTTGWNYLEMPFSTGDYNELGSIVWSDMKRLELYCNRSDGDGTQTISIKEFKVIKKPGFSAQASGNVKGTEMVEDPRPMNDLLKINGFISGDFQDCDLIRRDGDPNLSNGNSTSAGRGWRCSLHHAPATDYCEVIDVVDGLEGPRIFRIYDSGGGQWKAFTSSSMTWSASKWYRTSLYARGVNRTGGQSVYMPYNSSNTGGIRKSIGFSGSDLATGEWVRRHTIFKPTENASGNFYLYGHGSSGIIEYAGLMIEEFDNEPSGPPPPLAKGQYIGSDGVIYIIGGEFIEGVDF